MINIIENKSLKLFLDEEDAKPNSQSYIFIADFNKREVCTNCGDFYYDYSINFDDFIKFAKFIEKQDKIYNKEELN